MREAIYGVAAVSQAGSVLAPELPYRPRNPVSYRPRIGVIGCGGVSEQHLTAYHSAGYDVVALCDRHPERAEARRRQFFPNAVVYCDYRELLTRPDIEVIDATPHPGDRYPILVDAIQAGKHVLSQKPFVTDLQRGEHLVALARKHGVWLAVNQNGRWAPHWSWMRSAVAAGLIGDLVAVQMTVHWDHHWILGTHFERMEHLLLYDFAIHWFDILCCFLGDKAPRTVTARVQRTLGQRARPPFLTHALVEADGMQATLSFVADARFAPLDQTILVGSKGTLRSEGPDLQTQSLTLTTADGIASPRLEGRWFPDGFHGAMGELLCAIESGEAPAHEALRNLRSLRLCFAAVCSANRRCDVEVDKIENMPNLG